VGFTIVSFCQLSPTIWFSVSFVGIAWLLRQRYAALLLGSLALVLGVALVQVQQRQSLWSPYYKINVGNWTYAEKGNFSVEVNNDYHQLVLNLSSDAVKDTEYLQKWQLSYDFPYRIGAKSPRDVLVLGAGTGNDVAAALRNNANQVDAVELDPVIWKLGKDRHPEHPYADSRVITHINDARNFLREDQHLYDLIVMGWLDSHRLFSNLSNIRQDNFVYTVEAMRQAKQHLKDQGLLCLSFYVPRPWVGKKLFDLLTTAFGAPPRVFYLPSGAYELPGQIFVVGSSQQSGLLEGLRIPAEFREATRDYLSQPPAVMPIDDWPYLYYKDRNLSPDYQWTIITLWVLSFFIVLVATWEKRKEFSYQEALPFFLLGAGFMTLETKNLTAVALAFGSTWIVNSIVICGILLMALGANYFVERHNLIRKHWYWPPLLASLLINFFWHDGIIPGDALLRGIVLCVVVSISFFFAAVIFSITFKQAKSPSLALGINIFGGVGGGFAEYLNLIFGLKSLLVLALIFYGGAWIFSSRSRLMRHV
jgi:SAM-dependent methyltransferase